MATYPKRVLENILPFSISTELPDAFNEWFFTEEVKDHGLPIEDCGLCDQERLRYHFEIKNRNTNRALWVGSSCILKFHVQVFDNGLLLDAAGAKKKLKDLTQKMRLDSCLKALTELAALEGSDILSSALKFYSEKNYLTPKFAFVVFWRLNSNKIDYSPSFFKVSLRRDKYKDDLRKMPLDRVHTIWPALTSSQKTLAISYGHYEPAINK